MHRLSDLVAQIYSAMDSLFVAPFAFFGHSLGTLVAFELARKLRAESKDLPELLMMSGRAAPQLVSDQPPVHALPDATFIDEVTRRYNGIPDVVLRDAELLRLLLPTLRADIAMAETYEYREEAPLDCRMSVYGGLDDSIDREDLAAWQVHTARQFRLQMMPGDHFFFESERGQLMPVIGNELLQGL